MSLEAARDRIYQLEEAVRRLDSVRKHLTRNAAEICGEIRGNISRGIECLRNRELTLLDEVDQVQVMKEEALQLQQGRLTQAMNILRTAITLVQEDSASEKHLADTLERLNQLDLSPEETPYIAFRADQLVLRESLLNFGRVDANGLPLAIAFEDPGKPSASLPRHLEEYEDADHHVFYKTIQREPAAATSIRVSIPKLSQRLEDWLQKRPIGASGSDEELRAKVNQEAMMGGKISVARPSTLKDTRPASSSALYQMAEASSNSPRGPRSQIPSPGSSCSLNNWLSLIKNHADLEEEHDFEIVDNSRFKSKRSGQSTGLASFDSDLQKWLSPNSASSGPVPADFFAHITKDSRAWLRHVCHQLASLEELKQRDLFQHISKEPSTWLRSRAFNRQSHRAEAQSTTDPFSHISKDLSKWLLPQGSPSSEEQTSQVSTECDMSASDGLLSPAQDKWLLHGGKTYQSPSHSPRMPNLFSRVAPASAFLRPQTPSINSQQATTGLDLFSHLAPTGDASWLRKSPESCPDLRDLAFSIGEVRLDNSLWLHKKSQGQQSREVSPGATAAASDLSDWLLVPAGRRSHGSASAESSEEGDKESSSDCWSICSTPHSVSSDQHNKDVAIAVDYYNKWLL